MVDPASAQKAVNQFKGLIFPENRGDDLNYIKKAQEHMKKLQNVELRVKPIKAKKYGGTW